MTFCDSKDCPKKDKCGTHIDRVKAPKGVSYPIWQFDFYKLVKDGECKYERKFAQYTIRTTKESTNVVQQTCKSAQ